MTGLELVIVAVAGAGLVVVTKKASGPSPRKSRRVRGSKRAWLVGMYNSTGATPLKSTDVRGASAELAGRGTGRALRAIRRGSQAANERMAARHEVRRDRWVVRWAERQAMRPTENVIDRWRATKGQVDERRLMRRGVARARLVFGLPTQPSAPAPASSPASNPRPEQVAPAPPAAAAQPARSPRATPSGGTTMTAPTEISQQAAPGAAAPEDWRVLADRVANFTPEDDTALVAFMRGETAGVVAYADALEQARENCVNDVGLDPSAVQGLTTSSEHVSEVSERLAEALKEFLTVYSEVLELRSNGVTLPFDGRWFTGESA